jgi:hypothetical protein
LSFGSGLGGAIRSIGCGVGVACFSATSDVGSPHPPSNAAADASVATCINLFMDFRSPVVEAAV